jgi:hypothetical protein
MRNSPSSSGHARRAAFLCCRFAKNFAYYTVSRKAPDLDKNGFWSAVYLNFIDICSLEWRKIFGSNKEPFHWKNVLPHPEQFRDELLDMHGLNEDKLDGLWEEIKTYRDTFVAHLGNQENIQVPNMNLAYWFTEFYYRKLQIEFPEIQSFDSLPIHIDQYYGSCLQEAEFVMAYVRLK